MAAIRTRTAFVTELKELQLLTPAQMVELTSTLENRFDDPRILARELMQRGWLTTYQVNQVFLGQGKNLVMGPYRILDPLGKGGVARVFKAWHVERQLVAALKVLLADMLSNPEAVGRFKREMKVIAKMEHPNVVKAFEVGRDGETRYFAMEYVEGTDLFKLIQLSGPLPCEKACDFIRQAARGLQHAHEHSLVHRDIKPANLLLTEGGTLIKVLDLGLARLNLPPALQGDSAQLTMEGVMIGTPDWVSPEQATDARLVDIRSDIYSLGCTLYYLLTGKEPFQGTTLVMKLIQHRTAEPPPIEQFRSDVPPGVTAIVKKMMAKKPDDRYRSPGAVAIALSPFCKAGKT